MNHSCAWYDTIAYRENFHRYQATERTEFRYVLITRTSVFIKTTMMKKTIIAGICLLMIFIACSKSGDDNNPTPTTPDCSGAPKTFSGDVSPVIASSCAISGCHAAGSTNGPGALTNYTQVFNARSAIRTAVANGTMPKSGTISTTQKNAILCWIDNGAANN